MTPSKSLLDSKVTDTLSSGFFDNFIFSRTELSCWYIGQVKCVTSGSFSRPYSLRNCFKRTLENQLRLNWMSDTLYSFAVESYRIWRSIFSADVKHSISLSSLVCLKKKFPLNNWGIESQSFVESATRNLCNAHP